MELLGWFTLGIGLGAAVAWLVSRAMSGRDRSQQDGALANLRAEVAETRAELATTLAEVAAAKAQRDAATQRVAEISADRESLVAQFRALSAEAIQNQTKEMNAAAELRHQATAQLLDPVKESLQQFNNRITEVEKQRVQLTTELSNQVGEVRRTGEDLRRETAALVTALRKPQVRGAWGELQLKRVVELAGMVEHCDFELQQTTQTSSGSTIRPDLKVMLGDDRYLYVDAKVPLSAFLEAHETDDPQVRAERLSTFAQNVRTHVDQLGSKEYYKAGGSTPEYVVMFLGSEALAAEAFQQLPGLHEYAAERSVVVATPSSLIALLRAVAFAWRQAALAESAQAVYELGRELYDRLGTLGGHFDKVGRSLTGAVRAYNEAVGSIEGRVLPQARKLRDLKVVNKDLDSVGPVDLAVRPLAAPELVAEATIAPPMIGRSPSDPDQAGSSQSGLPADRTA